MYPRLPLHDGTTKLVKRLVVGEQACWQRVWIQALQQEASVSANGDNECDPDTQK